MISSVQLALMVIPLAAYFYLLALWQAWRHPRVVSGAVDLWLLALGVSGLFVCGPLGQFMARTLFGRVGPLEWLFLALVGFLVVSRLARRSSRRLVIYHVGAEALDAALCDVLGADEFIPTLAGYESRTQSCGIRVDHSPRGQSAVIEAMGPEADALMATLGSRLQARLRLVPAVMTNLPSLFFALSGLTLLGPLVAGMMTQPHTRAVLRALLERLRGG